MQKTVFSKVEKGAFFLSLFLCVDGYTTEHPAQVKESVQISKEFVGGMELISKMNPLGPELCSNNNDIRTTIAGRNLMLVKDDRGIAIIVTGSGPRYDTTIKKRIEACFKAPVLDVFDLMVEKESEILRDQISDFVDILRIQKMKLGNNNKIDKISVNAIATSVRHMIRQGATVANELVTLLGKIGIKNVEYPNRVSKQIIIPQNTKNDYETFVKTVDKYGIQLKTNVQYGLISMINTMMCWCEKLAPYEEQNLLENLKSALESLLKHAETNTERLASDLFSEIRFIKKDLGNIRLQDAKQQYALAHFLHSEQLAYIWLMKLSTNPISYMYTQRGMCETCNPFMLKALRSAPTKVGIMATYLANRPGREQKIEIDGTYELDTDGVTMHIAYEPKYLPLVRIIDKNATRTNQTEQNTTDVNLKKSIDFEKTVLNELAQKTSTPIKQFSEDEFQKWVNEQKAKL